VAERPQGQLIETLMSNDFYFIANMLLVSEGVMQLHVLKMHEKEIEEILARHPKWRDSSAIAGCSISAVNLND